MSWQPGPQLNQTPSGVRLIPLDGWGGEGIKGVVGQLASTLEFSWSPTSSSETSTMKQGGGQQRIALDVNGFSFCVSPGGNLAAIVAVCVGCCISWSRQTPSTRPLLRD